MTVKEIIERITAEEQHGVPSDDLRLRPRFVYSKLKSARAELVEKNIKSGFDDWVFLTIPCLEMEQVPAHDCPCIPPVGKKLYRSVVEVPSAILVNKRPFRDREW